MTTLDSVTPYAVDLLLKLTVVFGVTAALVLVMRRTSAAARHAVWASAFVMAALLPFAASVLPTWSVGGAGWLDAPALVTHRTTVEAGVRGSETAARAVSSQIVEAAGSPAPMVIGGALAVWFTGAALLLGQLLIHLNAVARLRRVARAPSARVAGILRERFARLGLRHAPAAYVSDAVTMPASAGLMAPAVLLPGDAEEWSVERLEAVVTHELAHIIRRDYGVHLLAEVVRAVFWVHPLVWFAARRLTVERERACDDMALQAGIGAHVYAESLLVFARRYVAEQASTALGMARRRGLAERVRTILSDSTNRAPVSWGGLAVIAAASVSVAVPVATFELFASQAPSRIAELTARLSGPEAVARRAAWALGEREDRSAVPALITALGSESADVRLVSAWALGEIKDARAVEALARLTTDADPLVREMAALALGETESPAAVMELTRMAEREPRFVAQIDWALGEISSDEARRARVRLNPDADDERNELWNGTLPFTRTAATDVNTLTSQLATGAVADRRAAAWNLGMLDELAAVDPLLDALRDPDPAVRAMVVWALDEINPSRRP